MKLDFGAMRERQTLAQQLGIGRTLPGNAISRNAVQKRWRK
jgi:hypothetical protein